MYQKIFGYVLTANQQAQENAPISVQVTKTEKFLQADKVTRFINPSGFYTRTSVVMFDSDKDKLEKMAKQIEAMTDLAVEISVAFDWLVGKTQDKPEFLKHYQHYTQVGR